LLAEQAGVAGFAGLRAALEAGYVDHQESVAVLMTGTLFKNLGFARAETEAHEIDADLAHVKQVIGS
jgi:threonine synthase